MERFFDPRGDDVEARDPNVLRHCRHCMIPMSGDYQRCLYYRDNHHRTCTRQGCAECALYCPYPEPQDSCGLYAPPHEDRRAADPEELKTDEAILRELKMTIRVGASSARLGPRSARQPLEGRGR